MTKKHYQHKSFYMTDEDQEILKFLSKAMEMNPSAVIRVLLLDRYASYGSPTNANFKATP